MCRNGICGVCNSCVKRKINQQNKRIKNCQHKDNHFPKEFNEFQKKQPKLWEKVCGNQTGVIEKILDGKIILVFKKFQFF